MSISTDIGTFSVIPSCHLDIYQVERDHPENIVPEKIEIDPSLMDSLEIEVPPMEEPKEVPYKPLYINGESIADILYRQCFMLKKG